MAEPENTANDVNAETMSLMAEVANRLVAADKRYSSLVGSMLASRQLYAMCLYELDRLCVETDFKKATKLADKENLEIGKDITDDQALMLKEMLVNAAAVKAQQPFEENQLFDGMMTTVFPWMRDVVTKHNEAQEKAKKSKVEEIEAARIAEPVDIGLPIGAEDKSSTVDRKNSILLVGPRNLINYLLNEQLQPNLANQANPPQLLRLINQDTAPKDDVKMCFLARSLWENSTQSNNAFQNIYASQVLPRLNHPVDVLVVDDLENAKKSLEFISPLVSANEAQKRFKRWADKAGCLLVGCLPLKRQLKANELNLPEYESLRIHNTLRGVASEKVTIEGVEHYRIFVGKHEACVVAASELDTPENAFIG